MACTRSKFSIRPLERWLWLALALCVSACAKRPTDRPRGVVLVLVEGLRADVLAERALLERGTPNLSRLVREGSQLVGARAPSSFAPSSFASVLTGKGPAQHGVHDLSDRLAEEHATLAERLSQNGWSTTLITADARLSSHRGMTQGFERTITLDRPSEPLAAPREAAEFAAPAKEALERAAAAGKDFFLVVVLDDPLPPWPTPSAPFAMPRADSGLVGGESLELLAHMGANATAAERAGLRALYEAGVGNADRKLGAVLGVLDERGAARDTLVLVSSLCGMFLGEERWVGEAGGLSEVGIRVPLLARGPSFAAGYGARADIGLAELDGLVAEYAGVTRPSSAAGVGSAGGSGSAGASGGSALLALLRGRQTGAAGPVVCEMAFEPALPAPHLKAVHERAVVWEGWKLIQPTRKGEQRLYDLERDPEERNNLAASRPAQAENLARAFGAVAAP